MKSESQILFNNKFLDAGSSAKISINNSPHINANTSNRNLKPLPTYSQLSMSNTLLSNHSFQDQNLKMKRTQTPPNNLIFPLSTMENTRPKVPYQMTQQQQQAFGLIPPSSNISLLSQNNANVAPKESESLNQQYLPTNLQPIACEPNKKHLEYLKYDNNWLMGNNNNNNNTRVSSTFAPSIPANNLPSHGNIELSNQFNYSNYLNSVNNNNGSPFYSPSTTPIRNNFNLYSLIDPQNKRITQPYQQQLLNQALSPMDNPQNQPSMIGSYNNQQKNNLNAFQLRSKSLDAEKFLNLDNGNLILIFLTRIQTTVKFY